MNFLYGKFEMNPITKIQEFYNKKEYFEISKDFKMIEYIDLLDDHEQNPSIDINYEDTKSLGV
jgi:hypothetical protein